MEETELTEEEIRAEVAAEVFDPTAVIELPSEMKPEKESVDPVIPKEETTKAPTEEKTELPPPDALQATIDALKEEVAAKELRLKQSEGRIGKLQSEMAEALKVARSLKDAPSKEEILAASESQKKWEEFVEDNPDLFEGIDSKVTSAVTATEKTLRKEIDALNERLSGLQPAENDEKKALAALHREYPDYYETNKSQEFNDWIKTQPKYVQRKRNSNSVSDVLDVLDRFHDRPTEEEKPDIQETRRKRLESAVETKKGKTPRSKAEADMTEDEYRQHIAAQVFSE